MKNTDYKRLVVDVTLALNNFPGGRSGCVKVFASTAFLEQFKCGNKYPNGIMGVEIIPVVSDDTFYCVGFGNYEQV